MAVPAPNPSLSSFFPDFFTRFRSLDQLQQGVIADDSQYPPLLKMQAANGAMQQQQQPSLIYNGLGILRETELQKQQEHAQGNANGNHKRLREVPCDEEALVLHRAFYGEAPPILTTGATGPSPVSTGLRLATNSAVVANASGGAMDISLRTPPPQTSTSGRLQTLDFTRQIQAHMDKHRAEVHILIESQAERMKQALEESSQIHARSLMSAIEENVSKRLKAKEDELEKANRKTQELEERLKQITVEAQLWRNLAKNNELMALNLRQSLEQVVAQVRDQKDAHLHHHPHHNYMSREEGCGESEVDDAESCQFFGGSGSFLAENKELKDRRNCKFCRASEACILLLPCRHLCLCRDCEGRVEHCPICGTNKNASVQVYMS